MQEIICASFYDRLLLNTHRTCCKCFVFQWLQQVAQLLARCCFWEWYSVNECQTGCAESVWRCLRNKICFINWRAMIVFRRCFSSGWCWLWSSHENPNKWDTRNRSSISEHLRPGLGIFTKTLITQWYLRYVQICITFSCCCLLFPSWIGQYWGQNNLSLSFCLWFCQFTEVKLRLMINQHCKSVRTAIVIGTAAWIVYLCICHFLCLSYQELNWFDNCKTRINLVQIWTKSKVL